MKELSLYILDIVTNSVDAGASLIEVTLAESADETVLMVKDNGRGMSPELLARVTDPFTTTRTTRKVGLGLPLLKMLAEQTGGGLELDSNEGVGTTLRARFGSRHIDMPPLGDIPASVVTLIQGASDRDFVFRHERNGNLSDLDTRAVREALDGVPLNEPDVLSWIQESLIESEGAL